MLQPCSTGAAVVGAGLICNTNGWHSYIVFYGKDNLHIPDGGNPPTVFLHELQR